MKDPLSPNWKRYRPEEETPPATTGRTLFVVAVILALLGSGDLWMPLLMEIVK